MVFNRFEGTRWVSRFRANLCVFYRTVTIFELQAPKMKIRRDTSDAFVARPRSYINTPERILRKIHHTHTHIYIYIYLENERKTLHERDEEQTRAPVRRFPCLIVAHILLSTFF